MKLKSLWIRIIPVLLLVIVTVIMSFSIYSQMIKTEKEICWNRLEIATNSTSEKIKIRITDNLNFLTAVADAYTLTHRLDNPEAVGNHLNSVMEQTIFERIDVILPNNTIITQEGTIVERGGTTTFTELLEKGTHITQRLTSSFTGEEVICCVTPIEDNNVGKGILVGTISCKTLSEIFEVFTYGVSAQLYLIDRTDGNYLMDNWHQELGNIYNLGDRESIDGKSNVDFINPIINGERVRLEFKSKTNGINSYQYCAPVEGFNWQVCVVVQENVVFANVNTLRSKLLLAGLIELIVIFIYVLWNVIINIQMIKSENKVKHYEYEKAKNDAKATFISNMSHDIKTPLNGIVGMLQIIKNHRDEEEIVDNCLQKIEISAKYLSTLTSDILDISEIENDKLILPEEELDLREIADDLTYMMDKQAKDVSVSFELDYSKLIEPLIIGSSVHIKRILVNLIGNAIKYSKNAGQNVWVTIEDSNVDDEYRMYKFIIKDNGIGMSDEFQKHMFKAFEQEANTARSEYEGYGLGLTIVYHLIKKMGGNITLESKKNVGTSFTILIPFKINKKKNSIDYSEKKNLDLSGLHILLVEDNEFNLEIANVLLSDAGATVDNAVNGKMAIDMFTSSKLNNYDLIIMDIMMPIMDGLEATKLIRLMERSDAKTIPIIAMTANTFSEDIDKCLKVGMNDFIPKPLDIESLINSIIKLTKD